MTSTTSERRSFLGMTGMAWALVIMIIIASAASGVAITLAFRDRDAALRDNKAIAGQSQQLVECVRDPATTQGECEKKADEVEDTIDDSAPGAPGPAGAQGVEGPSGADGQDATEVQEKETQDPETQNPEIQNPEIQNPEVDDPDSDDPEIQDPEIQDPEIQEPEDQDPEIDDPDPNSALMFAIDDSCNPPAGEFIVDVGIEVRRGDGVVTYVITCTSAPLLAPAPSAPTRTSRTR